MSYFDQLMAQTGIDVAGAPARPADTATPIVEIDVHQLAPPAYAGRQNDEPHSVLTVREPSPAVSAKNVSDIAPLERIEQVVAAQVFAHDIRTPEHPTYSVSSRPAETLIPEIVIGSRPAPAAPEITEQKHERLAQPVVQEMPLEMPATRPDAAKQPAAIEKPDAAAALRRSPTLIEIRNWVAATPAADEAPPEKPARITQPVVEVEQTVRSPSPRETSPASREVSERVVIPDVPQVELSIGSIQVVVEAPAVPVAPVRAQPASVARQTDSSPTWSRLARRYVRL
jgi:hypothetical protein